MFRVNEEIIETLITIATTEIIQIAFDSDSSDMTIVIQFIYVTVIFMFFLDMAWLKIIYTSCLLYTSPSPRDGLLSRMPSSA